MVSIPFKMERKTNMKRKQQIKNRPRRALPKRPKRSGKQNKNIPKNKNSSAPLTKGVTVRNKGAMKKIRIKHREYFSDVTPTIANEDHFSHAIQPGASSMFPWLSGLATRFENYIVHQLAFEFIPLVSAATNGAIALAPDYDPKDDDEDFTKREILTFDDCVRGPIWSPLTMRCSNSNLKKFKMLFVRAGLVKEGEDIKLTDLGELEVLISGYPTELVDITIGELYVVYDIELITPQLEDVVMSPVDTLLDNEDLSVIDTDTHIFKDEIAQPMNSSGEPDYTLGNFSMYIGSSAASTVRIIGKRSNSMSGTGTYNGPHSTTLRGTTATIGKSISTAAGGDVNADFLLMPDTDVNTKHKWVISFYEWWTQSLTPYCIEFVTGTLTYQVQKVCGEVLKKLISLVLLRNKEVIHGLIESNGVLKALDNAQYEIIGLAMYNKRNKKPSTPELEKIAALYAEHYLAYNAKRNIEAEKTMEENRIEKLNLKKLRAEQDKKLLQQIRKEEEIPWDDVIAKAKLMVANDNYKK